MGATFPPDYRTLLLYTDGFSTDDGVMLWSAETASKINEQEQGWLQNAAPECTIIGCDSGCSHVLLHPNGAVLLGHSGDDSPWSIMRLADSLRSWIESEFVLEGPYDV